MMVLKNNTLRYLWIDRSRIKLKKSLIHKIIIEPFLWKRFRKVRGNFLDVIYLSTKPCVYNALRLFSISSVWTNIYKIIHETFFLNVGEVIWDSIFWQISLMFQFLKECNNVYKTKVIHLQKTFIIR